MQFLKSLELLKRARKIIPSASQTYSKSYKYYCEGAAPAFLEKGEGAYVFDVDGNRYIDFLLGLGPVTLGYNFEEVNNAVIEQLQKGISFTQAHPFEVELAEKIVKIIPCAQMVRFLKNGSDATTAAVRLARAYTGRDMIACCGYHGFHDWYVGGTSNNRGVPKKVAELTKRFQYNDSESLNTLFHNYKGEIACVIMEPVSLDKPRYGYLESVKDLCRDNGTVLIFDEVITGFRFALGGAQEYFKVIPDLCTMGKGMANGMPLSFVAGKRDIMELIDHGAFISTTFGGETLSLAAAIATIKVMEKNSYFEHIWMLGKRWLEKVDSIIESKNLGDIVSTSGMPPHCGIIFKDFQGILSEEWKSLFIQEIIARGILSLGVNNYCLAHTKRHVDQYAVAVDNALDLFPRALESGSVDSFLKGGKFSPIFARN